MPAKKVSMSAKPGRSKQTPSMDEWVEKRGSTEETPTIPAPPVKMKRLTLDIPEPLHKAIKTRSVEEGVSMVDMLRDLLTEHYCEK